MVLAVFKTVALSQTRRGVGSTPMHSRHRNGAPEKVRQPSPASSFESADGVLAATLALQGPLANLHRGPVLPARSRHSAPTETVPNCAGLDFS